MKSTVASRFVPARLLIWLAPLSLASLFVLAIPSSPRPAETVRYQVLMSFGSTTNGGATPVSPLIEGSDGALYGTTHWSGPTNYFHGTIFKINKDGASHTVLHAFSGKPNDGDGPWSCSPS